MLREKKQSCFIWQKSDIMTIIKNVGFITVPKVTANRKMRILAKKLCRNTVSEIRILIISLW